ncbi:MAG: UDP-2,4-diacetamido-2,4,6-trideoxy-beta-L-altropyranose hydrolase [Methanoregula sp.]|nr:UDP-2,4-diacetamido-2,4,6-trideoxy-beta-L-altropyranose hydrolase [Methanoregula sp.]
MKSLIIRADASPEIGTGHIMRCLALAEAWQDAGGEVCFVSACDAPLLEVRLKKEGFQILHINQDAGTLGDADEIARIAHEYGADWIVVDGYHFGAGYQKTIKDSGLSLLFIDDYGHADHYYADIVLNQNIYADMSFYPKVEPYTRFLLGTKYALIRKEFLKWSGLYHDTPDVARKILVTLGGSDPDNVTLKVIEAMKTVDVSGLEVIVVIGGVNPHFDLIHETVKNLPNFTLLKNVENMPELMAWADFAISAGGSTCWELLFMGVPSIVVPIAENQRPIVRELQSLNIAKGIDSNELKNPSELVKIFFTLLQSYEMRSEFSKRMVQYIDGNGSSHIISAIFYNCIMLRKVELSDCKRIWLWINDPLVRSVSFNTQPISLECHVEWFISALIDPQLVYYIAVDKNAKPFGQARFQIESKESVISVLVDPEYRGRSLGSSLIQDATEKFFIETGIEKVKAFIKIGNEISRKSFIKAGYVEHGLCDHNEQNAYLLIKTRERK